MNHVCQFKTPCVDPNQPLANLSAEGPDIDLFLASNFGSNTQTPPGLGSCAINPSDPAFCHSNDPLAASICANNQFFTQYVNDWNAQCLQTPPPTNPNPPSPAPFGPYTPPVPPPPTSTPSSPQTFYNQQVGCDVVCPDGLKFTWTTLAGAIIGATQAQANSTALSIACQKANANYLCFTGTFPDGQVNVDYVNTISVKGKLPPYSFILVSGSVPTGLHLFPLGTGTDLQLIGKPTAAGSFTFRIQAADKFGHFMVKQFTVVITSNQVCAVIFTNPPWVINPRGGPISPPRTYSYAFATGNQFQTYGAYDGTLPTVLCGNSIQFDMPVTIGPALTCEFQLTLSASGFWNGEVFLQAWDGVAWTLLFDLATTDGTLLPTFSTYYPFTIPAHTLMLSLGLDTMIGINDNGDIGAGTLGNFQGLFLPP